MVQFVDVPTGNKGEVTPVNPDRVNYIRRTVDGQAALVFGAFVGGLDMIATTVSPEQVRALLEGCAVMVGDGPGEAQDGDEGQAALFDRADPAKGSGKHSAVFGEDAEGMGSAAHDDGEEHGGKKGRSK